MSTTTSFLQTLGADFKTLGQKIETFVESFDSKIETFAAPILTELKAAGLTFFQQDFSQILQAGVAAGLAVASGGVSAIEPAILAAVKPLAEALVASQAPQLGAIALSGIQTALAAQAKATVLANPVTSTNA